MSPMESALFYAEKGWPVFPVKRDKKPATPHGFKDATLDRERIERYWTKHPESGIGIACGNGLGVLDIDPRNDGEEGFVALLAGRTLPETPMCLTGGGGRHYYFSLPKGIPFPKGHPGQGLDWQADGSYVVAPPSPHPSGRNYAWELNADPADVPLSPLPDWLLAIVQAKTKILTPAGRAPIPAKIPIGQQHDWAVKLAAKLRWEGMTGDEILTTLRGFNTSGRFTPPIEEADIARIASDYEKKATRPDRNVAEDDGPDEAPPPLHVREVVLPVVDLMLHPEKRPKGFFTGFADLDDVTAGLHRGEVTTLGARTSMGKTSLALRIAENVAAKHDVLFFTVEMTKEQIVSNLTVGMSRTSATKIRKGQMVKDDLERIKASVPSIRDLRLWVDDTPGLSICRLVRRANEFVKDHPDPLVVVDYMQIVKPSGQKVFSRQEEVAGVSSALLDLARSLKVPVLAMAQLNRDADHRPGHWPQISDLRESGSIEHDSACVLLLHRPSIYQDLKDTRPDEAILQVVKNRHGPPGVNFKIRFIPESMRFEDIDTKPKAAEDGMEEVTV